MSDIKQFPFAKKKPQSITTHGHTRVDDYFWLREKTSQEVLDYLESENDYTKEILGHTEKLQEELFEEMKGRIQETDEEVPTKIDDFYYYSRTMEGKQYAIYCRKKDSLAGAEEILLDLNQFEETYDYIDLGVYKVSPDHKTLAYSLDATGAEDFHVFFKDLQTGETQTQKLIGTGYSGEWGNDNQTYFYITQDHAKRDYRLYRHRLDQEQTEDALLYEEEDELYRIYLSKTRDPEIYPTAFPRALRLPRSAYWMRINQTVNFSTISPRQKDLRYKIAHHKGTLFVLTNKDHAKNNQLMSAPIGDPGPENWQILIPHDPDVFLTEMDSFENHLVIYQRENGLKTITIRDLRSQKSHQVKFPESAYTYEKAENPEFESNLLRFTYMSLTTPDSVYAL